MAILLIFAFLSGLVTIAAPCIWPLLPIVLSSTATGTRRKALGVTVGICASFAFFTLTLSYIVSVIPLDLDALRWVAVGVIGFLGLTLIIPALSGLLEGYVSRLTSRFGHRLSETPGKTQGFSSGLFTGAALGVVWTPCAGPILATIATLAATQSVNLGIVLVTIVYVIGVGIPLFAFAVLGNKIFTKSRALSPYTGRIQQIFGVVMIVTAVLIATGYDRVLQARLLDAFPSYGNFLIRLESNESVKRELSALKGDKKMLKEEMPFPAATQKLPDLGAAPEFADITHWLNTEGNRPLTMRQLRGNVVLIDFWTYTCINCIRTLPHVTGWYQKYKGQGLMVVGVHTPEFEFEKDTKNVQGAMRQYKINYPVAQDNDYATWNAYDNRYWPAKYLIDHKGRLRYYHFGEGKYEETEEAIKSLLKEAGHDVSNGVQDMPDDAPTMRVSPEMYLGSKRMQYYYPGGAVAEGMKEYELAPTIPVHNFTLGGTWTVGEEQSTAGKNAALELKFYARKVFLVIRPPVGESAIVNIFLDGVKTTVQNAGADVKNSSVTVDSDRLYNLIDLKGRYGEHTLRLEFLTPGTQVFAFTFG